MIKMINHMTLRTKIMAAENLALPYRKSKTGEQLLINYLQTIKIYTEKQQKYRRINFVECIQ